MGFAYGIDKYMMCGENDRCGRPPMPWEQWTTHCRILRAQMHLISPCNHPVEYRGLVSLQWCPDECPRVAAFSTKKAEFKSWMEAHDNENASDGAWFAMLEGAGEEWLKMHPEKGKDGNDMAHRYLEMIQEDES